MFFRSGFSEIFVFAFFRGGSVRDFYAHYAELREQVNHGPVFGAKLERGEFPQELPDRYLC